MQLSTLHAQLLAKAEQVGRLSDLPVGSITTEGYGCA